MLDIRRVRPLIVIVLTTVALLPSMDEMITQGLSPLTVLVRLAEGLVVIGALVWAVSGVVLHYARIQAQSPRSRDPEGGTRS
jgi:hypothetical protein